MEAREEVLSSTPATAADEAPTMNSGPLWLQLGFEMPTEGEALRALSMEISNKTPSLDNILFTNRFAASFFGGSILDRAAGVESLATMGGMRVDDATIRVSALLARVSLSVE